MVGGREGEAGNAGPAAQMFHAQKGGGGGGGGAQGLGPGRPGSWVKYLGRVPSQARVLLAAGPRRAREALTGAGSRDAAFPGARGT